MSFYPIQPFYKISPPPLANHIIIDSTSTISHLSSFFTSFTMKPSYQPTFVLVNHPYPNLYCLVSSNPTHTPTEFRMQSKVGENTFRTIYGCYPKVPTPNYQPQIVQPANHKPFTITTSYHPTHKS
jgi:hypothetical protein